MRRAKSSEKSNQFNVSQSKYETTVISSIPDFNKATVCVKTTDKHETLNESNTNLLVNRDCLNFSNSNKQPNARFQICVQTKIDEENRYAESEKDTNFSDDAFNFLKFERRKFALEI